MNLLFSELPGRFERHLMRKHDNPLFQAPQNQLTQEQLTEAQRLDHEELVAYIESLRKLVGEAVALGPHEQSDVILELKERLDKAYETACRLADDQTPNKQAIVKLVEVIMRAVWKGAGNDTLAHQELQQEEAARQTHYALLEHPLVADLLDPESLILQNELLPVLLSAEQDEFESAITLFDPAQLSELCRQGEAFFGGAAESEAWQKAKRRFDILQGVLDSLSSEGQNA
ncbi:MAG: hypothetical protein JAY67_02250 [Candidatus Thiodiazotropha taylori]|nr:hypothetical protein [Candidatus Thiodiazotropha taylori]MCG7924334.1 hypothetical protein [Candidatus Thiodiazotropha taylori]MCG7933686.1 hypothetical protein [Candidatus Thiodiazotropha taylori]MCG7969651.1 hypothetical protein [Candidatus Thiodiazotropha taylori]